MKRFLVHLFLAMSFIFCRANDTLTIRQTFKFSVGDTLDYKIIHTATLPSGQTASSASFQRVLITAKAFTPDSENITYICQLSFPTQHADTFVYHAIDSFIISIDTAEFQTFCQCNYQLQTGIDSNGYITNSSQWATTDHGVERTYTEGLGITYAREGYGNPVDGGGEDDTSLIYYDIGGTRGGRPFYDQPNGIIVINNTAAVGLFPNPANDLLNFSTDNFEPGTSFILSDVLGKEMIMQNVSPDTKTINISHVPNGIYTWQLVTDGTIVKTGKVVKE